MKRRLLIGIVLISATFATNRTCVCVPQHMCTSSTTANDITNTNGFLDIRYGVDPPQTCENYFDICCDQPAAEEEALSGCGREQPIGVGVGYRITGGASASAQFGQAPWSAVLLLRDADRNMYKCGGALISHRVVITAAHCVTIGRPDAEWTVRMGEWDTRTQDEPLPHTDRRVIEVVTHPDYTPASLKNDVALLLLDGDVHVARHVRFVCLPEQGERFDDVGTEEGQRWCVASGWGKNAFKMGKHSTVMKRVELPMVERERCVRALRRTRLGKYFHLDASFVCAGGESDRDTCKGDGGSALVCRRDNSEPPRWVHVGIVAWGIGCGETDTPGVYANVALYRTWIDNELMARGLDITTYK